MTTIWDQFWFRFAMMSAKLSANWSTKIVMTWHQWTSRDQYHSATSLIRPIWRICNGLEVTDMVSWSQMGSVLVQICYDECQTFRQLKHLNWYDLAPMNKQGPVPHCNITYQTHMEDMQWSGGDWHGFMTTNGISFGSDLLKLCKVYKCSTHAVLASNTSLLWNFVLDTNRFAHIPCNIDHVAPRY